MRSFPVFGPDEYVFTRFVVVESNYPSEYFILVDNEVEGEDICERLENVKADIREKRKDEQKRKKQRYSADEVRTFLIAAQEIV